MDSLDSQSVQSGMSFPRDLTQVYAHKYALKTSSYIDWHSRQVDKHCFSVIGDAPLIGDVKQTSANKANVNL